MLMLLYCGYYVLCWCVYFVCCVMVMCCCVLTSAMENLSSSSAGSGIGSRTGAALDRITASWLSILSAFPIMHLKRTLQTHSEQRTHPPSAHLEPQQQKHVVGHHWGQQRAAGGWFTSVCQSDPAGGQSLTVDRSGAPEGQSPSSDDEGPLLLPVSVCLFVSFPHRCRRWCWSRWNLALQPCCCVCAHKKCVCLMCVSVCRSSAG